MNKNTANRNIQSLGLPPSISLAAISDAFRESGLALKYRRIIPKKRLRVSIAQANVALVDYYVSHQFTHDQAEWCADRDRENNTREWKLAISGELK